MKGIDRPLLFVAAASLFGFCVQQNDIKNLRRTVDSISSTEENVASLKLQLEELEKARKMEDSPFTLVDDWWVAEPKMFRFPQGVVVGDRNDDCTYGEAVLSVGLLNEYGFGGNCPSGDSSVAFGWKNVASGSYSSVTGGWNNVASGSESSVSGGVGNKASGPYSSVTGGHGNDATGPWSSVSGGRNNEASGILSSVSGGTGNTASGYSSSVTGGYGNEATGSYSSVSGGNSNEATGNTSSVSGG
eukprot:CAMPEP_0113318438 /NCGR_PEP_ID=MMETSP0010_2-20120614/13006_1 /TAXON_ID=216773 ORGANISM="Corethron hystrix, Strain 308" /NCGR_SAMPLE_ID=MMETSP0010_2 /ASSEMBLY_ACC=CAM_ASM_000155 /LENGTH=244 /DNA_ID=CAMNT_0000175739 /DNA_START=178 /DNA_END=909 /DNA_ORIENTATION=+ /assembly_acc=CAM_ASM_000155